MIILPYNPEAPALAMYALADLNNLGGWEKPAFFAALQHIGSTSIMGMPGSGKIDLLAGVAPNFSLFVPMDVLLWDRGWIEQESSGPGNFRYRRTVSGVDYHVHIVEKDRARWCAMLKFRNELRGSPPLCAEYLRLKHRLAETCGENGVAYTEGKSEFVRRVLARP